MSADTICVDAQMPLWKMTRHVFNDVLNKKAPDADASATADVCATDDACAIADTVCVDLSAAMEDDTTLLKHVLNKKA